MHRVRMVKFRDDEDEGVRFRRGEERALSLADGRHVSGVVKVPPELPIESRAVQRGDHQWDSWGLRQQRQETARMGSAGAMSSSDGG